MPGLCNHNLPGLSASIEGCTKTITRTYTATDSCNNVATCTQTIIVRDTTKPTISCPPAATVLCDSEIPAGANTFEAFKSQGGEVSDNCQGSVTITSLDSQPAIQGCTKTITRTYIATDSCNNQRRTQTITVQDTTKPTISCPPAATVQCDSEIPAGANTVEAFESQGGEVSDNCLGSVTITFQDSAPVIEGCTKTITRTYTATDSCNNAATCTQTITVQDTTKPTISCPPAATVQCDSEIPAGANTVEAFESQGGEVSDNCQGTVTITFQDSVPVTEGCTKTIIRTYTATDSCNNVETCTQTITLDDTVAPALNCPPATIALERPATMPMPAQSYEGFVSAGGSATDACSEVFTASYVDVTEGTCPTVTTRTWTVTDECGNPSTCIQTITLDDNTKPLITTCLGTIEVESPNAIPMPANSWTGFVAAGGAATDTFDSALSASYVDIQSGSDPEPITITRTWKVTDDCSNFATCDQIITVTKQQIDLDVAVNPVETACCGGPVNYEITLTNKDKDLAATNIVVKDILDQNTAFKSAVPEIGTFDEVKLKWTITRLEAGASVNLDLVATCNPTYVGPITNQVQIDSFDQIENDPDTSNNAASAITQVKGCGSITVTKDAIPRDGTGYSTQEFAFSSDTLGSFTLVDDVTGQLKSKTFTDLKPGDYEIIEQPQSGWILQPGEDAGGW